MLQPATPHDTLQRAWPPSAACPCYSTSQVTEPTTLQPAPPALHDVDAVSKGQRNHLHPTVADHKLVELTDGLSHVVLDWPWRVHPALQHDDQGSFGQTAC